MIEFMPFLSIVTPSYNRGHLLPNCFDSLLQQTDFDFEWIIVDDGSTDNTAEVVSSFNTTNFRVHYIAKKNGGKHTALNASMEHIRGNYVLILDSDDLLTNNAVETVKRYWQEYSSIQNVGVLIFLRGHTKNDPLCIGLTEKKPISMFHQERKIFSGNDCCEVIRTDLFKNFPFPVFDGELFLSEGALWNRVAMQYKCVFINEVLYLCEYLEDGLTRSGRALRIRNPKGGMFNSLLCMNPKAGVKSRIKSGLLFCCYGFFAKLSPVQILMQTHYKLLAALCILPGWLLYLYWNRKYG